MPGRHLAFPEAHPAHQAIPGRKKKPCKQAIYPLFLHLFDCTLAE
jgi:hypothetical protein